MNMRVQQLHPDLGAEVLGFDLHAAPAPQDLQQLRAALDTHQMLLFRCGERLTPEHQVRISSWFGPPVSNSGDGRLWSVLHNENAAGSVRLQFHSDLSYTDCPIQGLSLHPIAVPEGGTCTAFVSGVRAWSTLSARLQQQLANMTLRHRLQSTLYGDFPEFLADHPIKLRHPRTGQPVLFVTEHHAQRIHELDAASSERVLCELFAHLYAPDRIYVHRWQLYDLLIWDNIAIQHARPEQADPGAGERAIQRVALSEIPFSELVDRARRAEKQRESGVLS
jgi:taurine dioxygenase